MNPRSQAQADDPGRAARAVPAVDLSVFVERAQAGDEEAFRYLYREVQPGLLRYLRGLVADEAEDVASEAWAQIARDLGTFVGDGAAFRGWVATIGRNRAFDHLRRIRRRPQTVGGDTEEFIARAAADDTEEQAIDGISSEAAIALIATLPPDQAEAVLLRVVMGLDAQTAADVLGKRAGAVRTASHRGLRRLAAMLQDRALGLRGESDA